MTPKQNYRLAIVSNAPISDLDQAEYKGAWLIETAITIRQEEAVEKAKAEAEKE